MHSRIRAIALLACALAIHSCSSPRTPIISTQRPTALPHEPSPAIPTTIHPSATAPRWLATFHALQTEQAATPDFGSLFPVKHQTAISISPYSIPSLLMPGSLLLRESAPPRRYFLLDLSSQDRTYLPGDQVLIPPDASALISPGAHLLAYTDCEAGQANSVRVVDGSGNELPAPTLPSGPAWLVSGWAENDTLLAFQTPGDLACSCFPDFDSAPDVFAAIDLASGHAIAYSNAVPFSTDKGSLGHVDQCFSIPALSHSPSLSHIAAVRSSHPEVGPPDYYLEFWQSRSSIMSSQTKFSWVSPIGWTSSETFAAVALPYSFNYIPGRDCDRRLWLIPPAGGGAPIADCVGDAILSVDRRFIAASLLFTGSRCNQGSPYYQAEIAVLDLSKRTSATFLLCDLDPGTHLKLAAWSPDNRFIALNSYSEGDPPLAPPHAVAMLDLEAPSASYFLRDSQVSGWMALPNAP